MQSFAVIPAAGRSARMGRSKLLLPWGERTVIEQVATAWRDSQVSQVVVVLHPDDVAAAQLCRRVGVEVVTAVPPPPDMRASIERGLAHVRQRFAPSARDAWLIAPADMPLLSAAMIDLVLLAHDPAKPSIVVPAHAGRRGHPVLFPWPLAVEVPRLAPGTGVNELLKSHPVREISIADPSAWGDLDTPEDYIRLRPPS